MRRRSDQPTGIASRKEAEPSGGPSCAQRRGRLGGNRRVEKESGEVLLFQGPKQHEGVRVVHDADAQPLP